MKNGKLGRMKESLPGEGLLSKPITRKGFLAGTGATSFALLLAACGGDEAAAPPPPAEPPPAEPPPAEPAPAEPAPAEPPPAEPAPSEEPPLKEGLAEGMYGGPIGFEGAERYQYPLDSEEGRAILGLRKLVQDGAAPDTLVIQTLNFARPQFETPLVEGAPTLLQLFEEETGIKIEFVETTPADEYAENLRNAATRNGSFDLATSAIEEMGDFVEAGLLRNLDEYVEKYQPSWLDPTYGYAGGEPTVVLLTRYKGSTYYVAFDNDTQPNGYRADLLEDPAEQAAFEDRYGRPLRFPITWEEQAEVAEFFTRDTDGGPNGDEPLYGSVDRQGPFWGVVNWNQRFVSAANPNLLYFNDDMSANVNNEAGIRALEEQVRALAWAEPDNLTTDWTHQYQVMGYGNGFMGGTFPNLTKFPRGNPDYDKGFIEKLKTEVSPGRIVDGALIRRPIIFYNISYGVNAFADPGRHEAAYLFLQWAGGARVYTFLTANPAGYQDPHHTYTLDGDPYVAASYGQQPYEQFKNIIPRTGPPITILGGGAYRNEMSEELQKAITGQISAEEAMKNVEDRWNKITEEKGVEGQIEAWNTLKTAYPTVVDEPPAA